MVYTHLTREERYQIEGLLKSGLNAARIAQVLGRAASTISRELARNRRPGERYWAAAAEVLARKRAKGCANAPRVDPLSWQVAVSGLREGWSPEEICGRVRLESCGSISHMTIYRRVRADREQGGSLWRHLRCRKRRYMRHGDGRGRFRPVGGKPIDQRPAIVESRKTFGHWEGDTMLDTELRGCLVTLVERKSRYLLVSKVRQRSAVLVRRAINRQLAPFAPLAQTLTLDNGKEFSDHANLKIDCYFARPYASWQRGSIENINGLLREYFPRSRPLGSVQPAEVRRAANKLNHRPRKCLGFRTPHEVLMGALEALRFER